MKIVIGLGNYGSKYEGTRHNIGFITLDNIAKKYNLDFKYDKKFDAATASTYINKEKVLFLKPMTYVNLSGNAVIKAVNYFDIELEDILVVYDDIDLDVGRIRIREKGGHGGHNGVRNIIEHLNSKKIKRIKIGIGQDRTMPLDRYVLGKFSKADVKKLIPAIEAATDAIELFVDKTYFKDIMTKHNTQTA